MQNILNLSVKYHFLTVYNMQKYIKVCLFISEKQLNPYGGKSLRDQFRTNYKLERERKSGSQGGDPKGRSISWVFYKEMSFLKKFMYMRPYVAFINPK